MPRYHLVMTLGYQTSAGDSLSRLAKVDKSVEFMDANADEAVFYGEVEALSGMDAAVKGLTIARRLEETLHGELVNIQLERCPESDNMEVN